MATVATSHGLSTYITSCIKNPLDPKTGTTKTFQERISRPYGLAATYPGPSASSECFDDEQAKGNRDQFFNHTDTAPAGMSIHDVESELKHLTDREFYVQLQQLKEANRKTLEECEKLFSQKYGDPDVSLNGSASAKEMVEGMFAAHLADRSRQYTGAPSVADSVGDLRNNSVLVKRDNVKDMSAKPPLAPSALTKQAALVQTLPTRSSGLPKRTGIGCRPRPSSAPSRTEPDRRAYSLDEEDWRKAMRAVSDDNNDDDDDDDENIQKHKHTRLKYAFSRVENMWEGFSIEDYLPSERRHSTASLANKKEKQQKDLEEEWHHRITIPKPFQMSLREAAKTKKKTKAQVELEEQLLKKLQEEEAECQKKFKAQPVPAHIYLPLYDEIQEKNEARRRYVKMYCKEMLKSMEKPFNFMKREEVKKAYGIQSATAAEKMEKAKKMEMKATFAANPVPKYMYDEALKTKHLEDEEYRKIRIKMRAQELLRSASLPPNMEAQQKMRESRVKEKGGKAKREQRKSRAKWANRVPDYDFLYREFQKQLAHRRKEREGTVVEPFSLETEKLRSNREQVLQDMERDKKMLKENRWPFQSSRSTSRSNLQGALSSSLDAIPSRMTTSAELRATALKSRKDREVRLTEAKQEEERRQKMRERNLRKYITERTINDPPRKVSISDHQKKLRQTDREQRERYEKYLEEMQEKVAKRPLLFEKETQVSAGKAAEKKFTSTLQSAGIDEEFLHTQSTYAPSDYNQNRQDDDGLQGIRDSFAIRSTRDRTDHQRNNQDGEHEETGVSFAVHVKEREVAAVIE